MFYAIGFAIPLLIVLGVLLLTAWGICHIFVGATIIRSTGNQVRRHWR